jgi:hypothetical protein
LHLTKNKLPRLSGSGSKVFSFLLAPQFYFCIAHLAGLK